MSLGLPVPTGDVSESPRRCDGELPCKRCKDDGLVCTAGVRKKVQYRKLPGRYAEVLESTQFTLVATIHKLYNMVRNSQVWELGEPDLNDRGLPVIHDIAQKLGYIREISDINLPTYFVFPEDEAAMGVLAQRLEDQHEKDMDSQEDVKDMDLPYNWQKDLSSPDLDHSKLENFWTTPLGNGTTTFLSHQSFECSNDFEFSLIDPEINYSVNFTSLIPSVTNFSTEYIPKSQPSRMVMEFVPKGETLQDMAKINHSIPYWENEGSY
ncbi:hypothetical protein TrVGV298_006667 [Trichoderma virens]|nr:hypothetical protein TrVGV298_006667 [Trichoderma virens]UKZ78715.1 hypothetical protein TrVFT333_006461 [Trichoderma virens FT-333]